MTTTLHAQTVTPTADEHAARRELRRQIARLEARGATTPAAASGPQLLTLAELESLRDAMLARTSRSGAHGTQKRTFTDARLRLEQMYADPCRHRHETVALADLGVPGCGTYRVKPRAGLIGMLAGWWQVTLSSGCP